MSNTVRRRFLTALIAAGCISLIGPVGSALGAQASKQGVTCEKTGKRKVTCPKKELRGGHGKNGTSGAQGPAGPAGPQGPAGAPGLNGIAIPLIFRGQIPTQNTPIFNIAGLLINASCGAGPETSLTGVSLVAGSVLRATDVVSGAISASNSTFVNDRFNLTPGFAQNNYVLTYLAGNGSSIVTADYGIANGGMSLPNVSCAVFGTVQVAAG